MMNRIQIKALISVRRGWKKNLSFPLKHKAASFTLCSCFLSPNGLLLALNIGLPLLWLAASDLSPLPIPNAAQ